MNFKELLLEDFNINLTKEMEEQFSQYFAFLVEFNSHTNLTSITDEEGVYIKHFYDSISLCKGYDFTKAINLCDIGAGAGFPSIPLKIVFPHIKVTIIDSLQKRTVFLRELIVRLGLKDVNIIHSRAEEYAVMHREEFDVVTARAVARLNILSELCLPLVSVGGYFISPKAASSDEELKEAMNAIATLGGKLEEDVTFRLPLEESVRHLLVINKIKETNKKYPRSFAKMKKNPL